MIKRAELRHPQSDLYCDAVLQPPPEPIICWLDSGCPSSKQTRQARSRHAWLFILVCVVIAGGLGLAVWHHNRVATNASGPSHNMASQRADSSPYRELQLLPHPGIVPTPPPGTGDISLERRPGDPG